MVRTTVHLWTGFILAVAGAFGSIFFLTTVSPANAKTWQLLLLYCGFFLLAYGISFGFGYFFRIWFFRNRSQLECLQSSRRQAMLWGFLVVVAFILQAASLLNFKTGALLLGIFVLLELYAQ